jgi:hypothetical protein
LGDLCPVLASPDTPSSPLIDSWPTRTCTRSVPLFYLMLLRALLGSLKHPLVLVDWSPVDAPGCFFLLRAAIPLAERSFVIYEGVHEREGCPKYQGQLLKALALMLPPDCIPILVADSGFRRPWFKAVEAQGWYYVGRARNRDLCRIGEQPWQPIKALYEQASACAKSLGVYEVTRNTPYFTQFYLLREPALGRKYRRVTGSVAEDARSRKMRTVSANLGCSPAICRQSNGLLQKSSLFTSAACKSKKSTETSKVNL